MLLHAHRQKGFTVIELLVVMAAMALLLSLAAPRYIQHLDHARETALKHTLWQMRDAIDKFYTDQGRYPANLQELVARQYLRALPTDPVLERADAWQPVDRQGQPSQTWIDVRSGAKGQARDGSPYASW